MNEKAFTLVELIVVITILAILATVAFVSLGGQTDNAKNTIKKDNLAKLTTSIENARINTVMLSAFVDPNWGTWSRLDTTANVWWTGVLAWIDYDAWDINVMTLEMKAADFKDGTNNYKYWYTFKKWWKYELAATLKEGDLKRAYVIGIYEPRQALSLSWTFYSSHKYFTLSKSNDIKKFYKWDYVVDNNGNIAKIIWESKNYMTIYLSNTSLTWNTISLASSPEVAGLIKSPVTLNPVTDSSEDIPYDL